ncbi:Type I Iterative Polyketide synthase (PKS) [Aspergillus melleus]|uniref:Type I Iterative Polyketide synthase (PKS) n=1 Tax=Aspergillus melleus TaxID=138277 RepID=A0ACC3ARL4_9EURO|nr:Type I Iterative Polyketide synthase (PKS) [Aspergillus melleus]
MVNASSQTFVAEPLAVVGLACRLPGNSSSPTALWRFLERGGIASNDPPASRFNLKGHEDGSKRPKTMRSPGGMFLEYVDPADIDAQFFGLTRAEAIAMDPQQRQLLEVVYEGLENAGIPLELLRGQPARNPEDRAPNTTVGIGRAMLSNRISHFLDVKGPSMTIDTACSGSLVSLDVASRYLQTGEIHTAIVAGCNLYLSPEHCIDLSGMNGAASPSGLCHTFDAKADGYIKSEAVNMVIVRRLSDALRDRSPIRAVIRGSASNSDGWTAGIASPSSEAQAAATRQAYKNAGISDVNLTSYLECHGTGTRAGDPIEVNGVASVFCVDRSKQRPLVVGSVRALEADMFSSLVPLEVDFDALKIQVTKQAIAWPDVPFRRASVNSFGYGGSNVHVILDEAKTAITPAEMRFKTSYMDEENDPFAEDQLETPHLLVFSANDPDSLRRYCQSLTTHLINPSVRIALPDLSHTLSERRSHHFHRAYLVSRASRLDTRDLVLGQLRPSPPRIGFVFTGQGAQWPQMGRSLLDAFPSLQVLLRRLDDALQSLPDGPSWTLLEELTAPRSTEHLRQPEFSQPLVTALQLLILDVLHAWGVQPFSVAGHSSGEIAAAVAAGYLSEEEGIKVAYYRGKAAVNCQDMSGPRVGMLAVGLAHDHPVLQRLLNEKPGSLTIACFNSPESVTLSGHVWALEQVEAALKQDGHFARLLQVDLAYHSTFMTDIAAHYQDLLMHSAFFTASNSGSVPVKMFSSVTGTAQKTPCDAEYWKHNMESPVLFDPAIKAMLTADIPVDYLIEIGPHGALAGPINQIKKSLAGKGPAVEYHAAYKRGLNAVGAMFDVAGQLFLSGGQIDVEQVNAFSRGIEREYQQTPPSVIIDLPNYAWNHSTKYWYESQASKDWRFRQYQHHDLLGAKVLGTSWLAPTWKKILRLPEITWLEDHQISGTVLFPAAGYIAMAIEAMYQTGQSRGLVDSALKVFEVAYRLRNVRFHQAMVLDGSDQHISFSMSPEHGGAGAWNRFSITTVRDGEASTEHCSGLICLGEENTESAPFDALAPLQYPCPAQKWYKAMQDVGYSFGPRFQPQIEIEAAAGTRSSRALLSFAEPSSSFPQSRYSVHPVALDGCLQSGAPSLWKGIQGAVDRALVPAVIDDLVINARELSVDRGMAVTSARYAGAGSPEEPQSYKSYVTVYDTSTKRRLVQILGLGYHTLAAEEASSPLTYMQLAWKPDIAMLSSNQLQALLQQELGESDKAADSRRRLLHSMLTHKKPSLIVVEFSVLSDTASLWWDSVDGSNSPSRVGTTGTEYHLGVRDTSTLLGTQEKYRSFSQTKVHLLDITQAGANASTLAKDADLVILHMDGISDQESARAIRNSKAVLRDGGCILIVGACSLEQNKDSSGSSSSNASEADFTLIADDYFYVPALLCAHGFESPVSIPWGPHSPNTFTVGWFARPSPSATGVADAPLGTVSLVRLSEDVHHLPGVREALTALGFRLTDVDPQSQQIQNGSTVLIIDEMYSPVLTRVTEAQWETIRHILSSDCRVLWVTAGAQLQVSNPHHALVHGMARVVRAEDPSAKLVTLDVESAMSAESHMAIARVLSAMQSPGSSFTDIAENEYVERSGLIKVSRVQPDSSLLEFVKGQDGGDTVEEQNLHTHPSCVRLMCRQPGMLDSLRFVEVAPGDMPLPDDFAEVDMHAAGLNYKDVATCLGIVPENQYLLGLEGAGVVRRVGAQASASFHVGQRVLVYRRGSFGNKVQCPVEGLHAIPAWMSFEEAATLPVVYLAVIYGLFDLANIQRGQSVLIHSAAGGVGIAAIQICRYMGADIYATVGNEEKRQFLTETFNLPPNRIFSSRNTRFAAEILQSTGDKGVDIVLNSLTGPLLDESWQIIADCGTMVELGKKDILDRNSLSMEPFNRNASYRAIDMSHNSITRPTVARLMRQMFDLIDGGHIRPIKPRKVFPYAGIADAIRYMRGGTHIGKIVVSREASPETAKMEIQPARRKLRLRSDKSYLIVGGLRGVCGSLALYLARHGAQHLVVMSRSGYADDTSQRILRDLASLGARCELVQGDVSEKEDVRRAFRQSPLPVGGIIQGAMVLRDGIYTSMTVTQYHEALRCKVQGTWNLHEVSISEQAASLDFFTMLSSLSGLVGQKGQANYAAGNAFLDSLATYRHGLGLPACSVDLGVIGGVGYISERQSIANRLDINIWTPINESLLHEILRLSIFQQDSLSPLNPSSAAHMITGIPCPQPPDATLLQDVRFAGLAAADDGLVGETAQDASQETRALLDLVRSDPTAQLDTHLNTTVAVVNRHFMRTLGLSEPMEPAKPLTVYGLDSLAAVEFRNWARQELQITITTLEVVGAKTLRALCEKLVSRMGQERVSSTP